MTDATETTCPGCGATAPEHKGPTHDYMLSSPACWDRYARLLAWLAEAQPGRRYQQLAADAYAAQHPGVDERRSRQSVCLHLIGLHLTYELGVDTGQRPEQYRRLLAPGADWPWLQPPASLGALCVGDVLAAPEGRGSATLEDWARAVWLAWEPHHDRVRALWAERGN